MKIIKNIAMVLISVSMGSLSLASAASESESEAEATAQAGASAGIVDNSVDVNQPIALSSATGGTAIADGGNVDFTFEQTFEGSSIPPSVHNAMGSGGTTPQLYTKPFRPGHVSAQPLITEFVKQCKPVAVRGGELPGIKEKKGETKMTQVIFWSNPSGFRYQLRESGKPVRAEEVHLDFPDSGYNGACLGVLVVEGRVQKDMNKIVTLPHVLNDAQLFALDEIRGFHKIHLVSFEQMIGYGVNVGNKGRGYGLSPGGSTVNAAMDLVGSLVGSIGGGSGRTAYGWTPGTTFLVFAEVEKGSETEFTISHNNSQSDGDVNLVVGPERLVSKR